MLQAGVFGVTHQPTAPGDKYIQPVVVEVAPIEFILTAFQGPLESQL